MYDQIKSEGAVSGFCMQGEMLVTVSHPCSEIALWDRNTLEKKKEIKIPLKLSGNAQIDGSNLYITSRNMNGIGIIDLGKH